MPARSKTQQRLMGQAYAYKTGELKSKDLNPEYADEIKKLAKSMTQKQLKDFASTKHKGIPEKVEESNVMKFSQFILENLESEDNYEELCKSLLDNFDDNRLCVSNIDKLKQIGRWEEFLSSENGKLFKDLRSHLK